MSVNVYKILHLAGVIFLFFALGAMVLRAMAGQSEAGRKLAGLTQGIALIVILVSGFGLLAKYQLGFPPWVWVKLLIWIALGGSAVLVRKLADKSALWWWVLPLLGVLAAYLGVMKPM